MNAGLYIAAVRRSFYNHWHHQCNLLRYIKEYHEEVKQTAGQHKHMKQLVKSKLCGDVGLLQDINNPASCITDTA